MNLWLNFTDENGVEQRVAVDRDPFVIGRHSSCDLCVADSRLSREHVRFESFGGQFEVSDPGSSNGTTLNGRPLAYPEKLSDGDRLDLGGGLRIEVEISAAAEAEPEPDAAAETVEPMPAAAAAVTPAPAKGPGLPALMLIAAPIFGLLLLVAAGALLYVFSGDTEPPANERFYADDDDDDAPRPKKSRTPDSDVKAGPSPTTAPANSETPQDNGPPVNLSDTAKVEQHAAAFLRRIAQNDPTAFITAEQAAAVDAKIKSVRTSTALADNIDSARKSSSQIKAIAESKNLKPQLLATAAIAKLGGSRGDVLKTAESMSAVLDKLGTQIGSELYDDSLLMIAAYDQGERGEFLKLRNTLQALSNQFPDSSRAIRTIWFLKKQNKLTDAEFEFALRFLAVGTITQNPKDFNVNTEALIF